MRKNVDLLVFWILIVVQTCTVGHIRVSKVQLNRVDSLHQGFFSQNNAVFRKLDMRHGFFTVDCHVRHRLALKVNVNTF